MLAMLLQTGGCGKWLVDALHRLVDATHRLSKLKENVNMSYLKTGFQWLTSIVLLFSFVAIAGMIAGIIFGLAVTAAKFGFSFWSYL